MYCPRCGQQQASEETRFCSRCRFLMQGMRDVIENGGLPRDIVDQADPYASSPRKRGLKQGGLLMLSSMILVPLVAMLTLIIDAEPFAIAITAIITFWGGFLRIVYALLFQSGVPTTQDLSFVESVRRDLTGKTGTPQALPPQQSEPIPGSYAPPAGEWKETNELQPTSVTEETTRTLDQRDILK